MLKVVDVIVKIIAILLVLMAVILMAAGAPITMPAGFVLLAAFINAPTEYLKRKRKEQTQSTT